MWPRSRSQPLDLFLAYKALAVTWAFNPFLVGYLQSRGLSLGQVFDLNVAFSLATILFEVPTGVLADRRGRRVAMALGGLVMPASCALFLLGNDFATFALAQVLAALSMTLSSGADSAFLQDYVREHLPGDDQAYGKMEGRAAMAKGVGNASAILLGMVLYRLWPGSVFVLTGLCTLAAAAVALRLPEPRARALHSARDDVGQALETLRRRPRLLCVVLYGPLTFVLLRLSLFADQPHIEMHLPSLTPEELSLAVGLMFALKEALGILVAAPSASLLHRFRVRTHTLGLALLVTLSYALMGRGLGWLDLGLMLVLAAAQVFFSQQVRVLMNRMIPAHNRHRATLMSIESAARRVLGAVALPLFGRAAESASLHGALGATAAVAAVLYGALGLWALYVFRSPAGRAARFGSGPPSALLSRPPA